MAAFTFTNGYVMLASKDLSDHMRSCTIDYSAEAPESTAMQTTTPPAKTRLGGLTDWKATVEFNQDFAAASVHATLISLVGTSIACVFQPVTGTEGATNPKFTGNAILTGYNPMGGKVGEVMITKVELMGTGILALDTTP